MSGNTSKAACAGIIVVLITSAFLLAFSFYVVEPNTVGVDYNKITQTIDKEKLYESGRIFLGVGHEMIIYETTQQLRDLGTQNGRTKDGLSVEFEVNYQFEYSRNIADLSKMYLEYKGGHVRTFDYYAACVIRDVLSGYTAFEAKTDRDVVAIKMMADVKEELSTKGVTVTDLKLNNFVVPTSFKEAIDETVGAEQQAQSAIFERSTATTAGETRRLTAQIEADLMNVTAQAEATSILNQAKAEAAGISMMLASEKAGYKALYDSIRSGSTLDAFDGMASFDVESLMAFIESDNIANSGAQDSRVAMDSKV